MLLFGKVPHTTIQVTCFITLKTLFCASSNSPFFIASAKQLRYHPLLTDYSQKLISM